MRLLSAIFTADGGTSRTGSEEIIYELKQQELQIKLDQHQIENVLYITKRVSAGEMCWLFFLEDIWLILSTEIE